jgi:hypothetical protein
MKDELKFTCSMHGRYTKFLENFRSRVSGKDTAQNTLAYVEGCYRHDLVVLCLENTWLRLETEFIRLVYNNKLQ